MPASPHPDYLAVDESRRWALPLHELYPFLKRECFKLRGRWAWRVLPHGALVAVRINPDNFRPELRISRKDAPDSDKGWERWAKELVTFLTHWGGEGKWIVLSRVEGKCDTTYTERKMAPSLGGPKESCVDCGEPASKGPYKEALCTRCATKRGAQESAARAKA